MGNGFESDEMPDPTAHVPTGNLSWPRAGQKSAKSVLPLVLPKSHTTLRTHVPQGLT